MLIRVKYTNNRFDVVRPELLDRLLDAGTVAAFLRRDGWAIPGIDPIRSKGSSVYPGINRRNRPQAAQQGVRADGGTQLPPGAGSVAGDSPRADSQQEVMEKE